MTQDYRDRVKNLASMAADAPAIAARRLRAHGSLALVASVMAESSAAIQVKLAELLSETSDFAKGETA